MAMNGSGWSLRRWACVLSGVVLWLAPVARGEVHIETDVVYGHKFGMALTMDVFQPEQANGAGVLFMVSGGWFSRWMPADREMVLFKPLLDRGFTVFAVRHGSSPKFVIPEIVEDVRRSVRFVRKHAARWKIDPERLGVSGGSAGGHLSLMLGTTADEGKPDAKDPVLRESSRVAAVAVYFPPTDLRPYVTSDDFPKRFPALQFDPELADDYSPLLQVTDDDAPTLLVHGDRDTLVPPWHSEKIHQALQKHGVDSKLVIIEGAGHGFSGDGATRAAKEWVNWFERHLLKKKTLVESN